MRAGVVLQNKKRLYFMTIFILMLVGSITHTLLTEIRNLEKEILRQGEEEQHLKSELDTLLAMKAHQVSIEEEIQTMLSDLNTVSEDMVSLMYGDKDMGTGIVEIVPLDGGRDSWYYSYPYQIILEGSFDNLKDLLERLQNIPASGLHEGIITQNPTTGQISAEITWQLYRLEEINFFSKGNPDSANARHNPWWDPTNFADAAIFEEDPMPLKEEHSALYTSENQIKKDPPLGQEETTSSLFIHRSGYQLPLKEENPFQ